MSDEIDEFHRWLGICISDWAQVENRLSFICWKCMRTSLDVTAVVFYQHRSLTNQLRLTDELIRVRMKKGVGFHDDYRGWKRIAAKIEEKLIPVRNRIAHQPVTAHAYDGDGLEVVLEMAFTEMMRPGNRVEPNPLRLPELRAHSAAVRAIVKEIDTFTVDVLPEHIR